VDEAGITVAYRKLWLGEAEAERFGPGDKPAVLDVDGWRLGLAICKDVSVPQHQADTAALDIDAYVAGTVMSAEERVLQDERASRVAASLRTWVAIASFAGATGGGYTECAGRSGLWSPDGTVVAQAGQDRGRAAHLSTLAALIAEGHLRRGHPGVRPAGIGLSLHVPHHRLAGADDLLLISERRRGVLLGEHVEVRLAGQFPGVAARGVGLDPARADE
jgi:predicted amidohydrolase